MAGVDRIDLQPLDKKFQNARIANTQRAEQKAGVGVFLAADLLIEIQQRRDRRLADFPQRIDYRQRRVEMVAAQYLQKKRHGARRAQVAEYVDQILGEVVAPLGALFEPKAE